MQEADPACLISCWRHGKPCDSIFLTTRTHSPMKRITGIILIAISAAWFDRLAIFGRFADADGIDTFTLLFLRFDNSAILMGTLLFMRGEKLPTGRTLLQLIGMGALMMASVCHFFQRWFPGIPAPLFRIFS